MAESELSEGQLSLDGELIKIDVADFIEASESSGGDEVSVKISLAIIERFSEGLYSSPNKAFEELVSNSYDAGAGRVWVYMPPDLNPTDSALIVIDDGVSMDMDGLQQLWEIGKSRKRDAGHLKGRAPIGKFGIGKLATYVLAQELTYIVCRDGDYRAVTMDYRRVQGEMSDPQGLKLSVVQLTEDSARRSLGAALKSLYMSSEPLVMKRLFDDADRPQSWTAAVMTSLKKPAHDIQQGRLKWVLSTSLPLNPGFQLWFNDDPIAPSKATGKTLWRFTVGRSEGELSEGKVTGLPTNVYVDGKDLPAFHLPLAGTVWGTAQLFEDSLQRGRSTARARSHGFFVRVRGRLINLDEASFLVGPELHHGTLTRFHMEINVDDLDRLVASPRESIQDSPELRQLREYMLAVFNRARVVLASADERDQMPYLTNQGRISNPPPGLTQAPLRRMLGKVASGDEEVRETMGIRADEVSRASEMVSNDEELLELVLIEAFGEDSRLVRYDPERKAAILNQEHPFINNYIDQKGLGEPLKLLALTELLTQAYMLDENIPSEVVARVMMKRDAFLRDLVKRHPRSALVVARQLREASNHERDLEDAVADALTLLGFSVQRIGGTGGTDGIATARLGRRGGTTTESYALTYDAKSSGKDAQKALQGGAVAVQEDLFSSAKAPRIQAGTARTSILRVHREEAQEKYNLPIAPEYTLLVAPGFQGDGMDDSLIARTCRNDGITPITVEDLARLVELFPLRRVTPLTLRELFSRRTPEETRAFVDDIEKGEPPQAPPVAHIIELLVTYSMRQNPVTVESLVTGIFERSDHTVDPPEEELTAIIRGLAALAPNSIYYDGKFVALNSTPEALYREWGASIATYPSGISESYRLIVPSSLRQIIQENR